MYWFTSDEHYGHSKILTYCKRPFANVDEMDSILIDNFNKVVKPDDVTIHAGDFTLKKDATGYISRLNGKHIFLCGGHDYWQQIEYPYIWEKNINGTYVVACHYSMRTWPKSFHGSIQLFGHSHGKLKAGFNQIDIGVDANNFYPVNLEQILTKINLWNKTLSN